MARPKVPLISRRKTLEIALEIINTEGLEALSIRRLADELNVNGASLYHHFANKDEILLGAARVALADARIPDTSDVDWRSWFMDNTLIYRKALMENPGLVAILLSRHPLRMALPHYDAAIGILIEHGIAPSAVMPLIETVESFVVGSVVFTSACRGDTAALKADIRGKMPNVATAIRNSAFATGDDALWAAGCAALIEAVLVQAADKEERQPPPTRNRSAAKSIRKVGKDEGRETA
jgi:TetR/AcrR family transcriptional regulator, tetracycline repressor protein